MIGVRRGPGGPKGLFPRCIINTKLKLQVSFSCIKISIDSLNWRHNEPVPFRRLFRRLPGTCSMKRDWVDWNCALQNLEECEISLKPNKIIKLFGKLDSRLIEGAGIWKHNWEKRVGHRDQKRRTFSLRGCEPFKFYILGELWQFRHKGRDTHLPNLLLIRS